MFDHNAFHLHEHRLLTCRVLWSVIETVVSEITAAVAKFCAVRCTQAVCRELTTFPHAAALGILHIGRRRWRIVLIVWGRRWRIVLIVWGRRWRIVLIVWRRRWRIVLIVRRRRWRIVLIVRRRGWRIVLIVRRRRWRIVLIVRRRGGVVQAVVFIVAAAVAEIHTEAVAPALSGMSSAVLVAGAFLLDAKVLIV